MNDNDPHKDWLANTIMVLLVILAIAWGVGMAGHFIQKFW